MARMSTPQELILTYRNFHSHIDVSSPQTNSTLFTCDRNRHSKPHLTIARLTPNGPQTIAHVTYPHFSRDIRLSVPQGPPLSMSQAGFASRAHTVSGGGLNWRWEREGIMSRSLRLIGNDGGVLAGYERSMAPGKLGTIRLVGSHPPAVFEAVVISGLAKVEFDIRKARKSGAAAAGAAAG